ncbi:MAG: glycosyl hydrolase 115 family protein, partial [Duncaniella sp.]|nr:glycosyl hydrolase 115 family protein [Duncaniella sp.]
MRLRRFAATVLLAAAAVFTCKALDNPGASAPVGSPDAFTVIAPGSPVGRPLQIYLDSSDYKGVWLAARNLSSDFKKVCGQAAELVNVPTESNVIITGSVSSPVIRQLIKDKKIDGASLEGKNEKYIMTTVTNPVAGVDEALVIAGSDMRGTIYGIYELSELIGVSPWYDWADVPVVHHDSFAIRRGTYTAGEPAVKYRGIFLNDEGPCLMEWVRNTYGTNYGDHRFYSRVFELILRLRGNFIWPAMWAWAFYADDPENSRTADEMGVIVGTSHHEPMARNHQEWARNRKANGVWNYATNQAVIDGFFTEGIRRMLDTEDVVTIGMRGDGDEAMSADADVKLLKKIINNQRKIIAKETGRPAKETPQVWALYKEVLDYYDAGLRVPDDVTILLCDDNWGNVRRLPDAEERKHPGGWGMYYHVDYVGAPRNSKTLNCTPIQNLWEQME